MVPFDFNSGNPVATENRRIWEYFCERGCFMQTALWSTASSERDLHDIVADVQELFPVDAVTTTMTMAGEGVIVVHTERGKVYTAMLSGCGGIEIYTNGSANTGLSSLSVRVDMDELARSIPWLRPIVADLQNWLAAQVLHERVDRAPGMAIVSLADFYSEVDSFTGTNEELIRRIWDLHIDSAVFTYSPDAVLQIDTWLGRISFTVWGDNDYWLYPFGDNLHAAQVASGLTARKLNSHIFTYAEMRQLLTWIRFNDPAVTNPPKVTSDA